MFRSRPASNRLKRRRLREFRKQQLKRWPAPKVSALMRPAAFSLHRRASLLAHRVSPPERLGAYRQLRLRRMRASKQHKLRRIEPHSNPNCRLLASVPNKHSRWLGLGKLVALRTSKAHSFSKTLAALSLAVSKRLWTLRIRTSSVSRHSRAAASRLLLDPARRACAAGCHSDCIRSVQPAPASTGRGLRCNWTLPGA
jgi:hypothetical protein